MTTQPATTELTAVEAAIIRDLVADHAADYYGGPFNLSRSDAARYVTEGHVDKTITRVDWRELWRHVAAKIDANPAVLTTSKTDRDAARAARNAQADQLIDDALPAFKSGNYPAALDLVDRAELIAPLYRPSGRTYDQYRKFIQRSATAR